MGGEGVSTFLEAVPHEEFVDVKNAGHMVASDQNDIFSSAVARFLESVAGTGQATSEGVHSRARSHAGQQGETA